MKKPTLIFLTALLLAPLTALHAADLPTPKAKPNLLFITADDMNHDSAGCFGCPIKDITPNMDRLAAEGMRFHYAYSTVSVCQPVRETMHSGLYPHRSGAMGFYPLRPSVRTLNQQLHDAGYLISMIGKNSHYQPAENFCVDYAKMQISRSPSQLAEATKKFIGMAKSQGKPFFHHVNCTDPHRPFIGANGPDDLAHGDRPSRFIKPEEVPVPGFLEEIPDIRREVAQYFTNVRRLDDCIGAVLKVLEECGERDRTLVMIYAGDHGMSFPFAKSNDYENSSRGALMFRWPGVIKPGGVDHDHLVSTLDFTPTLLEALGLPAIPNTDGRSFLPAMKGEKMSGWDHVFTCYNQNGAGKWLYMRSIRTKDRSYIWNAWSDGKAQYPSAENMAGLTWKAMLAAATTDAAIKARTDFYLYRTPEEFYDMTSDRCERRNLIADPARKGEIEALRQQLLGMMQKTGDPFAEAFAHRDQPHLLAAAKKSVESEYDKAKKGKAKAGKTAAKAPAGGKSGGPEGEKAGALEFRQLKITAMP